MKKQILLLTAVLVLSTQAMAQKASAYLIGTETKVTCSEEEIDQNYAKMGGGAEDQATRRANITKAGEELSDRLTNLIFKKNIRSHRMAIEVEDDLKMAACFTLWLSTRGTPGSEIQANFKENLPILEDMIKDNRAGYAKGDSLSAEEQNDIEINELLYANRGAITFIEAVFGLGEPKK